MTVHLYIAPAAHGKTARAVDLARRSARPGDGSLALVRVVVASGLQARAFRRRLAETGGALGVRVMTFDRLYAECLAEARVTYTELSEPVLYRLVSALIGEAPLQHYASLAGLPGFTQAVLDLIGELKANRAEPQALRRAIAAMGAGPRLAELADVYAAYQARLRECGWSDRAGLGWLALEALARPGSVVGRDWPLLLFDGFDDFSAIQLGVLQQLALRARDTVVTLTGPADGEAEPRPGGAHRRFGRTRANLEDALGVQGEPLPQAATAHAAPLAALESCLYRSCRHGHDDAGAIDLIVTTDRAAEARTALRWLKERIVVDGMSPADVALLARDITPYQPFIERVAEEFGLPLRLPAGTPLGTQPPVAALLALLALVAPGSAAGQAALPRRGVIDAWRSPYFDWPAALPGAPVNEGHAEALDRLARWGRVTGGLAQWNELFARVDKAAAGADLAEDDRGPTMPVSPEEARELRDHFAAFLARITPPATASTCRAFAGWLEDLIGVESAQAPAPIEGEPDPASPAASTPSLRMAARAAEVAATRDRDLLALRTLKQVLLGLVWAEEALATGPLDFGRFLATLVAAVAGARCQPPVDVTQDEVVAADVAQGRGLAFRAVALVGLAEGEFPALIGEDHFIRDDDRARLREHGISLRPSTESNEAEYFYEAASRARERLLVTRPRIADNGATWLPSPYWDEVQRLSQVTPYEFSAATAAAAATAASWPELLVALAQSPADRAGRNWVDAHAGVDRRSWSGVASAAAILAARTHRHQAACDGCLEDAAGDCHARFGPAHYWSASAIETYRSCPFSFYVSRVLHLSPRQDPAEDLDDRQRGNIYHRILERTYAETSERTSPAALLATLRRVAPEVLDEAPVREGFRTTRWWLQTRAEMEALAARAVEALVALQGPFVPAHFEVRLQGRLASAGSDFQLRGTIDRVDIAEDGRFRIIDYKSGGASGYTMAALQEGKKLQLGLYASAARDLLGLGEPASGFYFHIATAEPSRLQLEAAVGGAGGAIEVAVTAATQAIHGVQAGQFTPQPPAEGCPSFCPAASFCWHYVERFHAQ